MREDGARGSWPSDQLLIQWGAWKWEGGGCLIFSLVLFVKFVVNKFVKFVVNYVAMLDVHSGGPGEEGK
jgi:hypothetical protein